MASARHPGSADLHVSGQLQLAHVPPPMQRGSMLPAASTSTTLRLRQWQSNGHANRLVAMSGTQDLHSHQGTPNIVLHPPSLGTHANEQRCTGSQLPAAQSTQPARSRPRRFVRPGASRVPDPAQLSDSEQPDHPDNPQGGEGSMRQRIAGALASSSQGVVVLGCPGGQPRASACMQAVLSQVSQQGRGRALVLCSTRQTAVLFYETALSLADQYRARVQVVTGRTSVSEDILSLRTTQPHVLVGTPGRLMQLMTQGPRGCRLDDWFSAVEVVALDEPHHLLGSPAVRGQVESLASALAAMQRSRVDPAAPLHPAAPSQPQPQRTQHAQRGRRTQHAQHRLVTLEALATLAAPTQAGNQAQRETGVASHHKTSAVQQTTAQLRVLMSDSSPSLSPSLRPHVTALWTTLLQTPLQPSALAPMTLPEHSANASQHPTAVPPGAEASTPTSIPAGAHVTQSAGTRRSPPAPGTLGAEDGSRLAVLHWPGAAAAAAMAGGLQQQLMVTQVEQLLPQLVSLLRTHATQHPRYQRVLVLCPNVPLLRVVARVLRLALGQSHRQRWAVLELHARQSTMQAAAVLDTFQQAPQPPHSQKLRGRPTRQRRPAPVTPSTRATGSRTVACAHEAPEGSAATPGTPAAASHSPATHGSPAAGSSGSDTPPAQGSLPIDLMGDEDDFLDVTLGEAVTSPSLVLVSTGGVTRDSHFKHLTLFVQVGLPVHANQLVDYLHHTQQLQQPRDLVAQATGATAHQDGARGPGSITQALQAPRPVRSVLLLTEQEAPGLEALDLQLSQGYAGVGRAQGRQTQTVIPARSTGSPPHVGGMGSPRALALTPAHAHQPAAAAWKLDLPHVSHTDALAGPPRHQVQSHTQPHAQGSPPPTDDAPSSTQGKHPSTDDPWMSEPHRTEWQSMPLAADAAAEARARASVSQLAQVLRELAWVAWMSHFRRHTLVSPPSAGEAWQRLGHQVAMALALPAVPSIPARVAAVWGKRYTVGFTVAPPVTPAQRPTPPVTATQRPAPDASSPTHHASPTSRVPAGISGGGAVSSSQDLQQAGAGSTHLAQPGHLDGAVGSRWPDAAESTETPPSRRFYLRKREVSQRMLREYMWRWGLHRVGDVPLGAMQQVVEERLRLRARRVRRAYLSRVRAARVRKQARQQAEEVVSDSTHSAP